MGSRSAGKYPAQGLFVTGSGTDVGKTYVAKLLIQALRQAGRSVGVYKPAASGGNLRTHQTLESADANLLWEAAGRPRTLKEVCPQVFNAALAPHLAAEAEGSTVDEALLSSGLCAWTDHCDIVVIEGAGGLMSPLSHELYNADLALEFGYPLLVVVPNRLGVINDTLQTLITASTFREGLDVCGIVLSDVIEDAADASRSTNYREIARRCIPPIVEHVRHGAEMWIGNLEWVGE